MPISKIEQGYINRLIKLGRLPRKLGGRRERAFYRYLLINTKYRKLAELADLMGWKVPKRDPRPKAVVNSKWESFSSVQEAAKTYNCTGGSISAAVSGRAPTCKGLYWLSVEELGLKYKDGDLVLNFDSSP